MITSRSGRVPTMAPYSSALRPCQRPSSAPWMLAPSTAWAMESIGWSSVLSRRLGYIASRCCCGPEIPGNDFARHAPGSLSCASIRCLLLHQQAFFQHGPGEKLAMPGDQGRHGHGFAVPIALGMIAAEVDDLLGIVFILDAFAGHLEPEGMAKLDDTAHHALQLLVVADGLNERLVDFYPLHAQFAQVGQRRVAGAEVIQCHRDTLLIEFAQDGAAVIEVGHGNRFGHLQYQLVGTNRRLVKPLLK